MTTLVLTLVGGDRAGLVAAVADVVDRHGGNWENSQLAELSGVFAGVVEISVAAARVDELRDSLSVLDGLLSVTISTGSEAKADPDAAATTLLRFEVIGNDHPGIVREITNVLRARDISIELMTTATREAAMYGGRLFEATVVARVPASVDLEALTGQLERLAAEIQVDVTLGP